ncbi:glycosyltransferase [Paenibacillus hamazuiensis]|uniref:tetratricopeptide repeat-containing glycosyltransferase family 2 protein n=1 Tax=Paenibacillus hamazuiensis TaxID=2936508 RepID=UPI00200D016E|nr:glycosyltransferase [Paenibacillus hamazuiensis]
MNKAHESIIQALRDQRYQEAEQQAGDLLIRSPIDAQAWVFLGEALMRQGFGVAAQKVFNRAWILDPEAAWVQGINRELRKTTPGTERPDIDALLKTERPAVTAAVVVKNEARCIERCLASLINAVDEIVVMDSGSTDGTHELAAKFPKVRLYHTEFRDSFADLKNEALQHVRTNWVLWVDGDEWLHEDDAPYIKEIAGIFNRLPYAALLQIWQVNEIRGEFHHDFSMVRMFPRAQGLRYWGRIHEQVGPPEGIYHGEFIRRPVRIRLLHDGYETPIVRDKNKIERNLRLLEMMNEEDPDNPGWWMFRGRETIAAGRHEEALGYLQKADELAQRQPRFGRLLDVQMMMVKIHLSLSQPDQAERLCRQVLDKHPSFPDALYYMAQIRIRSADKQLKEAEKLVADAKKGFQSYRGNVAADHQILNWKADLTQADLLRRFGMLAEARDVYARYAAKHPNLQSARRNLEAIELQRRQLNQAATKQGIPDQG